MGSTNAHLTYAPSWLHNVTRWFVLVPLLLALLAGCQPIPTWKDKNYEEKFAGYPTSNIYTAQPGTSAIGDRFFRERMAFANEAARDFSAYLKEEAHGDVDQVLVLLADNGFVCNGSPQVRCMSQTHYYGASFKFRWARDPDHCIGWTVELDTRVYPEQEPTVQVENIDCPVTK